MATTRCLTLFDLPADVLRYMCTFLNQEDKFVLRWVKQFRLYYTFKKYKSKHDVAPNFVGRGHLNLLRWASNHKFPMANRSTKMINIAIDKGYLKILKWLERRFSEDIDTEDTCPRVARNGHLDMLMWLRRRDPPCQWDAATPYEAAKNGHLDVLTWCLTQDPPCPVDTSTLMGAIRAGHLAIVVWLQTTPQVPHKEVWNSKMTAEAAAYGHIHILRWLRYGLAIPRDWDELACANAAQYGHLETLKWLRSQTMPCPWDKETCNVAAQYGKFDILKWARNQDPPCPWDTNAIRHAEVGKHMDIAQWIRGQHPPSHDGPMGPQGVPNICRRNNSS